MTRNPLCGKIVHMSRLFLLGENIKKYRNQKNWSQEFLAEKLELSKEYICRVERGQKYLSLKKLFQLADALDVKFFDLTNFD